MSIDSYDLSRKFVGKLKEKFSGAYDFPFLEDKNHRVIDKQGIVRWKFIEVDYRKRPTNEQVLQVISTIS